MTRAKLNNPIIAAAIRTRLRALVPNDHGAQAEIDERLGKGRGWLWNRLNGKAPIYAEDVAEIAQALDLRITDLYADTAPGQREITERVQGLDREIVMALATCSDRQKRVVLQVIRGMLEFAREEGDHAEESSTETETVP